MLLLLLVALPSSLLLLFVVAGGPLLGGGIFARRSTSAKRSGKFVHVPERRSSSARARTRSGQPFEASEVVSVSESCGIVAGSFCRWRRRARCVGCGSDCGPVDVEDPGGAEERLLGTGMAVASGGMEDEEADGGIFE